MFEYSPSLWNPALYTKQEYDVQTIKIDAMKTLPAGSTPRDILSVEEMVIEGGLDEQPLAVTYTTEGSFIYATISGGKAYHDYLVRWHCYMGQFAQSRVVVNLKVSVID